MHTFRILAPLNIIGWLKLESLLYFVLLKYDNKTMKWFNALQLQMFFFLAYSRGKMTFFMGFAQRAGAFCPALVKLDLGIK